MLSVGHIFAGLFSCTQPHAPLVTLTFQNIPPRIETAQSPARMQKMRKKALSPDYGGEFPNVDGLADGTFGIKYDLDFTSITQMMLRTACIHTKDAHITITYTPVIYISDGVLPGSCRHAVTLAHEMRHVNTDVNTIRAFLPAIKSAAAAALAPVQGTRPLKKDEVSAFQKSQSEKLSQAMEKISLTLQHTRQIRQMKIDTREEYRRLSRACPSER